MGALRGEREPSHEEKVGTGYWRGWQEKVLGTGNPMCRVPGMRGNMRRRSDCRRPGDTQGKSRGRGRCSGPQGCPGEASSSREPWEGA